MVSSLGDDALASPTVKKWAAEFKRRMESLQNDPRSGHPSTATTQENIDRFHQIVMNERQLTISHLVNVISTLANEWRTFSTTNLACQKF